MSSTLICTALMHSGITLTEHLCVWFAGMAWKRLKKFAIEATHQCWLYNMLHGLIKCGLSMDYFSFTAFYGRWFLQVVFLLSIVRIDTACAFIPPLLVWDPELLLCVTLQGHRAIVLRVRNDQVQIYSMVLVLPKCLKSSYFAWTSLN